MATRPREATLRAKVSPAMPLPRTRKSNSFMNATRGSASQPGIVNQSRLAHEHRQCQVSPLHYAGGGLKRLWMKEFNVVHARIRLLLDPFPKLLPEPCGRDRPGRV